MNNPFTFEAEPFEYGSEPAPLHNRRELRYESSFTPSTNRSGFGSTPRSFALRVRIVGYASPRWRGAKSATEADRLNFQLSSKRAETVYAFVEKELRARLGANVKIDYAVSQMEPDTPRGIEIGSYGVGSVDALAAAHGNRMANPEINRKVEVMIEKITTTYTTGGVSLPPQRAPGKTDSWALGVTKLRMLAAGAALGSVEIVLRNRLTGKQMFATADLYGGGIGGGVANAGSSLKKQLANALKNNLTQAVDDFIGRGEVFFTTKDKMGFDNFNGQFIRIGKALASLGIKAVYSYAVFPFISHHPKLIVFQKKITVGLPDLEGWVVSGKLQLRGPNPGDWWEYDRSGQVHSSYDKSWQETLVLTFPTGKWALLPADRSRLTDFVATWVRRYLSPAAQQPEAEYVADYGTELETESGYFPTYRHELGEAMEASWEAEALAAPIYLRSFSGPAAECMASLTRAGKTRGQALAIINNQIDSAIRMLRVAAAKLKRGNRSAQTNAIFRKIFRVPPSFVPIWLRPTASVRDRGDVVATRCRRVADLLASGTIRFFCAVNGTNCPDCRASSPAVFACSSWGQESTAPQNSNVICLGTSFWDDMRNGNFASMLSTLMHEPFHIYFGIYVTEHGPRNGRSVGKFGGINCIVQFVFQINRRNPPQRVTNRCAGTAVRRAV